MTVRTYSPCEVKVSVGGQPITGFADSSMIDVERDEDSFTKYVGATGEVSRAKNCNRAGNATIHLSQTSPTNDLLSKFADADEASGAGVFPIIIKDLNGTTLVAAADAWVKKRPPASFGKEVGDRQWIIDTGPLAKFIGGAVSARSSQEAG